jgi:hypothetical protein
VAGGCVYYGRGPLRQSPTPATRAFANTGLTLETSRLRAGRRPDGDLDFVFDWAGRAVNRGDGACTWQALPAAHPAVPVGFQIASGPTFQGDFDGDRAPDLVTPLELAGFGHVFSHMGLFRNNGSGQIVYAGPAAATGVRIGWLTSGGSGLQNALCADLDGDGDDDLIANSDPGYELQVRCEIWWNTGQGIVHGRASTGRR